MTNPQLLGALASIHELQRELFRSVPDDASRGPLHPRLGCLSWQLAGAVYRETYWLREVLCADADLTARIGHLFPGHSSLESASDPVGICAGLPPRDHLLAWAGEIQDEHLRRLANPGELPEHPLMDEGRLAWFVLQENARAYERMIVLRLLHALTEHDGDFRVERPIGDGLGTVDTALVNQGHYRIGSRNDPFAYDNELPPQAVELSSFRIARAPVTNGQYLAFMLAGGYSDPGLWDDAGRAWLGSIDAAPEAPLAWRRDARGHWYEVGINGPVGLLEEGAVSGINRHEARAFAAWAAARGQGHEGAVLQHEYQWELAARSGMIEGAGRVWEWCANPFHPYPDFSPFPDPGASQLAFERGDGVLRGASIFTQPCQRRASYRQPSLVDERACLAGLRLVYPSGDD